MKKLLNEQILSELNRMREIMGLPLLTEGVIDGRTRMILKSLGYTDSYIDNIVGKTADDLNLNSLADEFTTIGVKNSEDLVKKAAAEAGVKSIDDVSEEAILGYIKKNPKIMSAIESKVAAMAKQAAEINVKNLEASKIFSPDLLEVMKSISDMDLSSPGLSNDIDEILAFLDDSAFKISQNGGVVPDSLIQLRKQFAEQKKSIESIGANKSKPTIDTGSVVGTTTDDVIELNPTELLSDVLKKHKETLKQKYPDVSDEMIDDITNELTTAYGKFDYDTLVTKLDELSTSFNARMKSLQDEADEFIKQGQIDKANKKKAAIENLKKFGNFLADSKIAKACIGSKVKPGTMGKATTMDINLSTVVRTPTCLLAGSMFLNFFYNLQKDPMDKEFVACPLVNLFGACSSLPAGWCQVSCGQRTENYVGVNECFGSVPGWSDMPFNAKNGLISLGLDCSFRQKEVAPEKLITNIKYFPATGGGVEYWIITMNGKNYTVNSTKGLPTGNSTPTPTPTPNTPTNCPGKSAFETAVKNAFGASYDSTKMDTFDDTKCIGTYDGDTYTWNGSDWVD